MGKSNEILNTFGECTRALIELLHENPKLEMVEQMFLESHLGSSAPPITAGNAAIARPRNNSTDRPSLAIFYMVVDEP